MFFFVKGLLFKLGWKICKMNAWGFVCNFLFAFFCCSVFQRVLDFHYLSEVLKLAPFPLVLQDKMPYSLHRCIGWQKHNQFKNILSFLSSEVPLSSNCFPIKLVTYEAMCLLIERLDFTSACGKLLLIFRLICSWSGTMFQAYTKQQQWR